MSEKIRTPIFVLTGFLGSGKTVLLNALLRQHGFADTAVVVNEFGEIGLDHLLVSEAQDNIVLLDAGCLCCAVLGSLKETLADLYQRRASGAAPPFRRVVIETSGLADPAPILQSIMRDSLVSHFYHLAGVICVVDALHAEREFANHAEARAQVGFADRLVITKTDRLEGQTPRRLEEQLRAFNPTAEVLVASNGDIPAEVLLSQEVRGAHGPPWLGQLVMPHSEPAFQQPDAQALPAPGPHHHYDELDAAPEHDAGIGSASFWIDRPATWAGLAAWTEVVKRRYGRNLLRCKGMLNVVGQMGPVVMHGVQTVFDTSRLPAWPEENTRSRLVVIGRGLHRTELKQSLDWLFVPEGTQPPLSGQSVPPPAYDAIAVGHGA